MGTIPRSNGVTRTGELIRKKDSVQGHEVGVRNGPKQTTQDAIVVCTHSLCVNKNAENKEDDGNRI